jgi:AbrB family looped-hinge helix DNA binding protein
MTSKGQVTITANLREALRLKPGDRVLMMLQDDGSVQLERLRDVDEIVGSLTNVSVDVRKEWREISAEGQEELAKGALKYMDREQDR